MQTFITWLEQMQMQQPQMQMQQPQMQMQQPQMQQMQPDQMMQNEIKKLLGKDYASFVKTLGQFIKEPKFLEALRAGSQSGQKLQLNKMSPAVSNLHPCQNEIDITASLSYPLSLADCASKYLAGGTITVKGPIITGGNGKYIIDGHHRWSQVYLLNPKAQIVALDVSGVNNPDKALKVVQLGIAASSGKIPSEPVKGTNLLQIAETTLKQYVLNNIQDQVVQVFQQYKFADKNAIADYIWKNTQMMQQRNAPVSPAANRNIMPQTDAPNAQAWPQYVNMQLAASKIYNGKLFKEWLSNL